MERRDYLELMTGQIRCKKMCPVIAKEVEDHIEDQKQVFMAEGMKEEEAEKAAVEEMGDPVEVGVEMDQIHRPKMPRKAIFVPACDGIFGYDPGVLYGLQLDREARKAFGRQLSVVYGSDETFFCPSD